MKLEKVELSRTFHFLVLNCNFDRRCVVKCAGKIIFTFSESAGPAVSELVKKSKIGPEMAEWRAGTCVFSVVVPISGLKSARAPHTISATACTRD